MSDSCSCREGFDGPRCQQTKISFSGSSSDGATIGWAWFPGLDQCDESHTSFELITTRDSGLLLYYGPMKDLTATDPAGGGTGIDDTEDFLIVELRAGYPVVRVNFGTGETRLTLDGRDKSGQVRVGKLSDGRWHRVDIFVVRKVCASCYTCALQRIIILCQSCTNMRKTFWRNDCFPSTILKSTYTLVLELPDRANA